MQADRRDPRPERTNLSGRQSGWRRFDPPALYAAVDAERKRRGLTWAAVAAETGVAAATIRRTRHRGRFELEGILFLTQWLARPVEDFTRGE